MTEITGRCKANLLAYLRSNTATKYLGFYSSHGLWFSDLSLSLQWGIYQDFFDSVGLHIDTLYEEQTRDYTYCISDMVMYDSVPPNEPEIVHWYHESMNIKSRQKAREGAVKLANKIYNERTNRKEIQA